MKSFLKTINYSSCNEDSRSEFKALNIQKNDSILCITGSGARPLDLLIQQPAEIIAIDFNPCQNFLLELKINTFEKLEYDELLQFFGILPSENRQHVYNSLRSSLSSEAKYYWDRNMPIIKKGLIYEGRWEKYFKTLAQVMGIERPRIRDRLFGCEQISEQIKVWEEEWDSAFWRSFLRLISPRLIWKSFFGDPGFFKYVPGKWYIHKYISDKFKSAIQHFLLKDSPFARLLFFGKYNSLEVLPIYLKKQHFKTIKENLSQIRLTTDSVYNYLTKTKTSRFSKYSLSDFNSYLTDDQYQSNWEAILKTAVDGAIICERQWLVKRDLPKKIQEMLLRNDHLEKELALFDDSIFYTFTIAQKV